MNCTGFPAGSCAAADRPPGTSRDGRPSGAEARRRKRLPVPTREGGGTSRTKSGTGETAVREPTADRLAGNTLSTSTVADQRAAGAAACQHIAAACMRQLSGPSQRGGEAGREINKDCRAPEHRVGASGRGRRVKTPNRRRLRFGGSFALPDRFYRLCAAKVLPDAHPLQVVDRGTHLVSVPRRPSRRFPAIPKPRCPDPRRPASPPGVASRGTRTTPGSAAPTRPTEDRDLRSLPNRVPNSARHGATKVATGPPPSCAGTPPSQELQRRPESAGDGRRYPSTPASHRLTRLGRRGCSRGPDSRRWRRGRPRRLRPSRVSPCPTAPDAPSTRARHRRNSGSAVRSTRPAAAGTD